MMKIQIKLWAFGEVKTETVDAEIIDEVAVYQLGGLWTVGHVSSGAWLAAFTHRHVAVNFANRLMSLYSIDYYYQVDDVEYRKQVTSSLKNWRQHVASRDQNSAKGHYVPCAGEDR
jgi:hypothetical protein